MPLELKEVDKQNAGFFRFKLLNSQYLLTNDIGEYCFLEPPQFDSYLSGKIEQICPPKYEELKTKGFIRDMLDFDTLSQKYASKNMFLGQGPSLHIIVVTLRCNHSCIYCQSGSQTLKTKGLDMDISTAKQVIDRIFESPSQNITIEFQGGEPLANFDTVKFIIEYANKKNATAKKNLLLALVSNLTFMTQERLAFLVRNNVSICTSLDGSEILHNRNRISKVNSYKNTARWIKNIQKEIRKNRSYKCKINALTTITKFSLSYPKEIIDEFLNLGLEGIHLRPVNPFGINKKKWKKISFSAEEFLSFYKESLDYIIKLNLEGKKFFERTAQIFLTKILTEKDPNYVDIRSPCGAGIGQLAYNFNGDVYTCDEARMLSAMDEESFKIGNVVKNTYQDFINNEIVKTMCLASCLDNLAGCSQCVYKPYCGVCPIYNYVVNGNIFYSTAQNQRCKIHMLILDYLFNKLEDFRIKNILNNWVN